MGCFVSATDSQDVVQEVFRAVALGIGRFQRDRSRGTFRGWLWTIARNEARDHFASWAGRPQAIGGTDVQATLLHVPDESPEEASSRDATGELATLMRHGVGAIRGDFQDRTWQALWRTTIEGNTTAEVARDLGMLSRAVRQAKYRVLQRLREEYRGLIYPLDR